MILSEQEALCIVRYALDECKDLMGIRKQFLCDYSRARDKLTSALDTLQKGINGRPVDGKPAFVFNFDFNSCKHGEDLKYIYDYLNEVGTLNINPAVLYVKYCQFCCNFKEYKEWITPNEDLREEFALWLSQEVIK